MEKIDKLFITVAIVLLIVLIITRIKERRENEENNSKESLLSSPNDNNKEDNQVLCCKKICKNDIHCMENCLQEPSQSNKNIEMPYQVNGLPSDIPQFVDVLGPSCPQCNNSRYYSYGSNNTEKCRYRSFNSKANCSGC